MEDIIHATNKFPDPDDSDDDVSRVELKDTETVDDLQQISFDVEDVISEDEDTTTAQLVEKREAKRKLRLAQANVSNSSSSSSSSGGAMTTPPVPLPISPSPQGKVSVMNPINNYPQIRPASEAYYMQSRQAEFEAAYSFADLDEVFENLSIREWIEILSCMRGLTAQKLLGGVKKKDPGFRAALSSAQLTMVDIQGLLHIHMPQMMMIFNSQPVVPEHYSVPTEEAMIALAAHLDAVNRNLTLLMDGENRKAEILGLGPMTVSSNSSSVGFPQVTITESRQWQPASKIWSDSKTLTVMQYLRKDEHRSIDDYLVYFHSQLWPPLEYMTEDMRQSRLREIFIHAVEDQESRKAPYKSYMDQNHPWGTLVDTKPDTCIQWIRLQFRNIWENEYPIRRMRDFHAWLKHECLTMKKDLTSVGKIILGKLQVLLHDIKCFDNGKPFQVGGPNPAPFSIYLEAVLVDQWHEAIKSCSTLTPLLNFINSERQKQLRADPSINTLTISSYLYLLQTYQFKSHENEDNSRSSASANSSSSNSSNSSTAQINYVASQDIEVMMTRPQFRAESRDMCRLKEHTTENLKPHHWKDCPDNPKCWRTSDPARWAALFHFPPSAANNPKADPKQCGSGSPLFLAENKASPNASSADNSTGTGRRGGKRGKT